ncbi:hypothetical protein [Streptomyces sp. TLI_171]|uniref:hypothetical protein n=1 Tax=Streptomyces sp. TLI_171 TaxID=1938859 RepID=UPI000C19D109|nr:hypothetical protein [Streptomyces sp. TLI_171]
MGLSDQFKDQAKDLADQAKEALGNRNPKREDLDQKARDDAEREMAQGHDTTETNLDDEQN